MNIPVNGKIENWELELNPITRTTGRYSAWGFVDGSYTKTSAILDILVDGEAVYVKTKNSLYELKDIKDDGDVGGILIEVANNILRNKTLDNWYYKSYPIDGGINNAILVEVVGETFYREIITVSVIKCVDGVITTSRNNEFVLGKPTDELEDFQGIDIPVLEKLVCHVNTNKAAIDDMKYTFIGTGVYQY